MAVRLASFACGETAEQKHRGYSRSHKSRSFKSLSHKAHSSITTGQQSGLYCAIATSTPTTTSASKPKMIPVAIQSPTLRLYFTCGVAAITAW